MVNHARTLLLNALPSTEPLGEYVDPSYEPATHPLLDDVRNALIGADSLTRLVRVRQLMTVLHVSDAVDYIYELDSRLTYLPFDVVDFQHQVPDLSTVIPAVSAVIEGKEHEFFMPMTDRRVREFVNMWSSDLFCDRLVGVTFMLIHRTGEVYSAMERRKVLGVAGNGLPGSQ